MNDELYYQIRDKAYAAGLVKENCLDITAHEKAFAALVVEDCLKEMMWFAPRNGHSSLENIMMKKIREHLSKRYGLQINQSDV